MDYGRTTVGKIGFGCLGLVLLVAGFAGGVAALYYFEKAGRDQRTSYRLDGGGPLRPIFLRDSRDCKDLSEADHRLDQAMLDVAAAAKRNNASFIGPLHNDVVSYFAWHWSFYGKGRCPPTEASVQQLAPILEQAGWPQANTPLNDLRLAERLPANKSLANGLASIGFLGWIPPSDLNGEDARPYARQLLAEQGEFALRWSKQALGEISGDSRLGTSAAYLAVATIPDAALPKVRQAMTDKLHDSRNHQVDAYRTGGEVRAIRPDDANRLIELGYALARAGDRAQPYSQPVIDMLSERIARSSPPFGLMTTQPTEFCRIARHIGGKVAETAKGKPFCAPGFKGGDGAPRQF
jgi:hypothetical protein